MSNFFSLFRTASTNSGEETAMFLTLLGITVFFTLLIGGAIIYFLIRFRASSTAPRLKTKLPVFWMEVTWTLVPLLIVLVLFVWAASLFQRLHKPPKNAVEIFVTGRQWMWKIQQPNGRREINELHVPIGVPVKLTMISEDVIHSFFVPAFRVKNDVLPGRYTSLWFQATRTGAFHLFCSQYCGTSHSKMTGTVFVMEPKDYEQWLGGNGPTNLTVGETGLKLYVQYGCAACHKSDGTGRAPAMEGLVGKTVSLADGSTVLVNDDYLRESILTPGKKIVKGYDNLMPTFQGLINEEGLRQLLIYIKSLSPGKKPG